MNGVPSLDDSKVLEAIFNPEHPIAGLQLPPQPVEDPEVKKDDEIPNLQEVKALETAGVKLAEGDKLTEALEVFDQLIALHPNYPSAYNNRAQVYRLLNQADKALSDLNTAIQLSGGLGKAAEQAYTQRGLIHVLHSNEDEALQDFQRGAALGSQFAKSQVVKMNPYSKLCNQMLTEAINKLNGPST
ncbi:PREDICTED: tetratricopeptide repeat protein 36-like [Amphimedon queenslandica]|uniref:Uncharacterized protein n=1 Tax=Amphimedon queenslandica TaxID=400682 RepID=A0A1X7U1F2_AMPQE|nr:PREDICTED: tetratricopeptide repeat protein 36-like [Amphimedon queenslandica]|eukprot:XP_003389301.1 PREDICTED: tetratricopeptide repeat protein 36-like [Amphimedon queenslandica]